MTVILGETYRDKVSGFEGVATSRTTYLAGCVRVALSFLKDGEPKDYHFDEPLLELVEAEAVAEPAKRVTGGARNPVPRTGH